MEGPRDSKHDSNQTNGTPSFEHNNNSTLEKIRPSVEENQDMYQVQRITGSMAVPSQLQGPIELLESSPEGL